MGDRKQLKRLGTLEKNFIRKKELTIRLHKSGRVHVDNSNEVSVKSSEECQKWIHKGFEVRTTAATLMNVESSRSHLIVIIQFERRAGEWCGTGRAEVGASTLTLFPL